MTGQPTFPTLLERFFTQRLMQQRQASAHTIASYRDTFRLLLQFAQKRLRRAPSTLALEDIDASLVVDFLDVLEKVRNVTARTRNLRLTAIHSFFRYVAFEAPANAAQIQRVLAIPAKRFTRALVPFLSRLEVDALLAAPDQRTWSGRRDHAFILLAVQTGLRLSELTGLRRQDVHLGIGAHVRVIGKGRKERCTPLSKNTRTACCLDEGTARHRGSAVVPECTRRSIECARRALPIGQARRRGNQRLPIAEAQARKPACASTHNSDGSIATRRRAVRDCAVARSRVDRDHAGLFGCQS
jgi:site-specific recombinase XerD